MATHPASGPATWLLGGSYCSLLPDLSLENEQAPPQQPTVPQDLRLTIICNRNRLSPTSGRHYLQEEGLLRSSNSNWSVSIRIHPTSLGSSSAWGRHRGSWGNDCKARSTTCPLNSFVQAAQTSQTQLFGNKSHTCLKTLAADLQPSRSLARNLKVNLHSSHSLTITFVKSPSLAEWEESLIPSTNLANYPLPVTSAFSTANLTVYPYLWMNLVKTTL